MQFKTSSSPPIQMLGEFVADAVHATASVFLLTQPLATKARRRAAPFDTLTRARMRLCS
jgi:hypothetical protein